MPPPTTATGRFLKDNGTWDTPAGGGGGITTEDAVDAVAAALVAGNNIDVTYNDTANTITVDVEALTTADVSGLDAALAGKQPLDTDLTTIAGLTATTDNVIQSAGSAWASRTPAQLKTTLALTKADVGLGNVDNTADTAKPVSTAQAAADALKADKTTTVTTTAPLTGSGTLAANLTLGVAQFSTTATTSGVVPGSNNAGAGAYLDGTGAWTVPPTGGGAGHASYTYNSTLTEPPATGQLRLNNATQSAATKLWVHQNEESGLDVSIGLAKVLAGHQVYIQDYDDATKWVKYNITAVSDDGAYYDFTVTYHSGPGGLTPGSGAAGRVEFQPVAPGTVGVPPGGAAGQILGKTGSADYAVGWVADQVGAGGGLDAEGVMDLLGTTGLVAGNNIDLVYNDGAGTITVDVEALTTADVSGLDTALTNKQPLDTDLTTIAGLTATTDNFIQAKASAWASRTVAQVKTDLGLTGTNSGDQTTIAGITGTTAQFNTANSDADFYTTGGTDVAVADGGTGRSTGTTAYALVATGTTATGAQQTLASGATTEVLVGGGASALPVWTTATGTGAPVRATSPTLVTPALGTPASGTLTNCTGLPVAGITASTATAIGVGTVELGHATDTTLSRTAAGTLAVEGVAVPTISSTSTLTNKTIALGSNTVSGTLAQVNTAITDADIPAALERAHRGVDRHRRPIHRRHPEGRHRRLHRDPVMPAYIGSTAISAAYVGSTSADKIYLGTTQVWSAPTVLMHRPGCPAHQGTRLSPSTWTAPASNGGSPMHRLRHPVRRVPTRHLVDNGHRHHIDVTSAGVTGLTNGTAYVFRVAAENTVGVGPYSTPSAPITPAAATGFDPTDLPNSAAGGMSPTQRRWRSRPATRSVSSATSRASVTTSKRPAVPTNGMAAPSCRWLRLLEYRRLITRPVPHGMEWRSPGHRRTGCSRASDDREPRATVIKVAVAAQYTIPASTRHRVTGCTSVRRGLVENSRLIAPTDSRHEPVMTG